MAGRTIRICPPRTYTFDALSGGANGVQTITIAERIDVSQYEIVDLVVRVVTAFAAEEVNSKIEVVVVSDGFTPDDPSKDFFGSALATAQFLQNTSYPAGTLKVETSNSNLGAMLAVRIVATPGTAAGDLSIRIAIDLVLKTN